MPFMEYNSMMNITKVLGPTGTYALRVLGFTEVILGPPRHPGERGTVPEGIVLPVVPFPWRSPGAYVIQNCPLPEVFNSRMLRKWRVELAHTSSGTQLVEYYAQRQHLSAADFPDAIGARFLDVDASRPDLVELTNPLTIFAQVRQTVQDWIEGVVAVAFAAAQVTHAQFPAALPAPAELERCFFEAPSTMFTTYKVGGVEHELLGSDGAFRWADVALHLVQAAAADSTFRRDRPSPAQPQSPRWHHMERVYTPWIRAAQALLVRLHHQMEVRVSNTVAAERAEAAAVHQTPAAALDEAPMETLVAPQAPVPRDMPQEWADRATRALTMATALVDQAGAHIALQELALDPDDATSAAALRTVRVAEGGSALADQQYWDTATMGYGQW